MPRLVLRRRRLLPRWKRRFIFWTALSFAVVFTAYVALVIVERNVEPVLRTLVETRVKQVAAEAVREALREQLVSRQAFEDVIRFVKDREGNVQSVVIDQSKQMQLHEEALSQIQAYLTDHLYHYMQEQGLDKVNITLGQMFNSRLFADRGPSIPVSIIPKGAVNIEVEPSIESAGINNILVKLMMIIRLDVNVIVPFPSDTVSVNTRYPLATAVVIGDTPQWYWNTTGHVTDQPVIPGITPEGTRGEPSVPIEGNER